ncbi:hypothetical protein ER308_03735 [Egibacter rhizosphaerae]|uniref:Uncharacterized protein n=1 Tax=Egibacter rhizosphaerae TaxID=1670831 RepID=A0A411YC29_9ACTN|nr:hypothetical protein [Egibacter rhizosphaerae]QBI18746.1 hypothetical protein ER308_03735 [Egibacter rhizosphaerae]
MNATTIATQAINQARSDYGEVDSVALPQSVFEAVQDEVTAAGGEVGFDHAIVDGIPVHGGIDDDDRRARIRLPGAGEAWIDLA